MTEYRLRGLKMLELSLFRESMRGTVGRWNFGEVLSEVVERCVGKEEKALVRSLLRPGKSPTT